MYSYNLLLTQIIHKRLILVILLFNLAVVTNNSYYCFIGSMEYSNIIRKIKTEFIYYEL